jgi:hypothetical protein
MRRMRFGLNKTHSKTRVAFHYRTPHTQGDNTFSLESYELERVTFPSVIYVVPTVQTSLYTTVCKFQRKRQCCITLSEKAFFRLRVSTFKNSGIIFVYEWKIPLKIHGKFSFSWKYIRVEVWRINAICQTLAVSCRWKYVHTENDWPSTLSYTKSDDIVYE